MATIIAAVAKNGVIGNGGKVPWRLPHDMERFKRLTLGGVGIMGRSTWESLPPKWRPLPGRRNIVITSNHSYRAEGAETVQNLEEALNRAGNEKGVFLIGGERVYKQGLQYADRLLITLVHCEPLGDTFFHEVLGCDPKEWWLVLGTPDPPPPEGQPTSEFLWYHRISPPPTRQA